MSDEIFYGLFVAVWCVFSALASGIYVLSADTLIEEALNAHENGEEVSHTQSVISPASAEKKWSCKHFSI